MHVLNNQALIVLGMHRSGTSVLAGALHLLGVELSDNLMVAQPDNESGFWEHDGIVKLHDELLAALGSSWDDICPLPSEWWLTADAQAIRREIAGVLLRDFSSTPLWALKDPRMCRLLPLWIPLFEELNCQATYILTSRSPWDIARSLVRRDDFSTEKSLLLCLENLYAADTDSRGQRRTTVRFEDIVNDPVGALDELGRRLGIQWPKGEPSGTIRDFVKKPRNLGIAQVLAGPTARWIGEILLAFESGAAGDASEMQRRLDVVWAEWLPARQLYTAELNRSALIAANDELKRAVAAQTDLSRQFLTRLYSAERETRVKKLELRGRKARLEETRRKLSELQSNPTWKLAKRLERAADAVTKPVRNAARSIRKRADRRAGAGKQHEQQRRVLDAPFPKFPVPNQPIVSIVIPVYNHAVLTKACLLSIAENAGSTQFEVIVVDDGSTDETAELARRSEGLRYFRNAENGGFIVSCNHGAAEAHGDYLLFLNNDTTVTPGWIETLCRIFETNPEAGLAGSKLIYPDGTLQEAGALILSDGTAVNIGNKQDPANAEYNFVREVDYCSAASAMIRRDIFRELGGFDMHFAPGYYEDADLAFRVRERGLKVFYQPLSQVIHYEGGTAGTDVETGMKQHQEINRLKFFDRWAGRLATHPIPGSGENIRRRERGAKSILVIDDRMPMPDQHAGGLRMFEMLRIFRGFGHSVTFMPVSLASLPGYTEQLQQAGIEVIYKPWCELVEDYLRARAAEFDIVILSRLQVARRYLAMIRARAPKARIIFDTVDLHFLRESREAMLHNDPKLATTAAATKAEELLLMREADETWVVSPVEKQLLEKERVGRPVAVVPTIQEIHGCARPFAERRDFLFIGGFEHRPNLDAVLYFAADIFPLVHAALPEAKFQIIGSNPPPAVEELASEHIIVSGFVPDVTPLFQQVKLTVAPLRFGAGVKGKLNMSLGHGVPAVATTLAIEGMGLIAGEEILTGDSPAEFAAAVIQLYREEVLWNRLSAAGLEKTKALYSIEAARQILAKRLNL